MILILNQNYFQCPGVHGSWASWGSWAACTPDCLQVQTQQTTFSREHPFPLNTFVCFVEIQIPGATSSLLEPHPNKWGSLLSGQRHEQQTLHLRPLPAQPCCFKRPPCHHRPQRPGHRHRHQRPHLVHRPRCGLPHICPRGLHHCPAASAQAESSPELQLHPRR